ncbi:MAG: calcium-binding protein [Acidimicrobiia bacterium]
MAEIIGTLGDDILTGGSEDDEILGLSGADLLEGQAGDDTLVGGNGDDTLFGGPGGEPTEETVTLDFDTLNPDDADFFVVQTSLTEDGFLLSAFSNGEPGGFVSDGTGSSLFVDALRLGNSPGTTTLTSVDGSTFTLESIDLDAVVGAGTVTFTGETSGGDTVDPVTFTLEGDSGFETFEFGADFTDLVSVSWTQALHQVYQFDNIVLTIEGAVDDGNDVLVGGNGDDTLFGGTGDDELDGGRGDDLLVGGDDQDALVGDNGSDELFGGGGDDDLDGGKGSDTLDGGDGNDILTGGKGSDTFVFGPGSGDDTITDFDLDNDVLSLTGGLVISDTSEEDVDGDSVTDTVVTFDSGDTVALLGVSGITDPGDLLG